MDYASLVRVLECTVSVSKNELDAAEQYLEHAVQADLAEFLKLLSEVLKNAENQRVARVAAALQIKNALTAKDETVKGRYQQRWLNISPEIRNIIKENVLKSLGTEHYRPSSAAQCVAYIAVIEIPVSQWSDVIETLCRNVISESSDESLKESSLEAIGYICQEIEHQCLAQFANHILTAIIHGMRKEETSRNVRLAATNALHNSLEFTRGNFDKESERNYIMEVVCEATQSPDTPVKVAALQCLVRIMSLYYHYMEPYMGQALFPITLEAMKSDIDEVALQGIEFWSNVSDEEVDLAIEGTEAAELGQPPTRTSRFYAKGALQFLVPILMQKLTQQEEFDDEDEWNPSKSASVCLVLLASCCEGDIVPHVLPFVKDNIKHADWRYRDAALMAFGSILSGLDQETMKPLVENALPTIIELMYDTSVAVRDTAAWTIGRICEIVPEFAINPIYLKKLLETLVDGLKSEPRVAANVCWALIGLSEAAFEAANNDDNTDQPKTYCLSPYFEFLLDKLVETTDRTDGAQANLRSAAYECLMEMIKNSPLDCYPTVQKMTLLILNRLNQVLQLEVHVQTPTDKAQYTDLQGLLCATLQSVVRKMTPEDAPKISDEIMRALLCMFNSTSGKSGGVQEDAMLATSTLIEVLGAAFLKYMEAFKPFLLVGLKNHAEYSVCLSAVGVVGDICRAIHADVLPYCDEIMFILIHNLGDPLVHRSVKPHILSVFGDVALAIGPEFKKYLDVVLTMLTQATQARVDKTDYDMVDYLHDLREAILESYTGIIQGLKGDDPNAPFPEVNLLEPHIPFMVEYIKFIAQDQIYNDAVISATAGLIGDLCTTFKSKIVTVLDVESVNEMLAKARKSRVLKTKNLGTWACRELRKLSKQQAAATYYSLKYKRTWVLFLIMIEFPVFAVFIIYWVQQEEDDGAGGVDVDVDLDDLLPHIGEFGRYQKLLIWLVCLPSCIPCGFGAFNQLFMGHVPDHWCAVPELNQNFTQQQRRTIAIPLLQNNTYSKCSRYILNETIISNFYEHSFDDSSYTESWPTEYCYDGWEYNLTQVQSSIVIDFDLVCNRDIYPTIGLAALNTGGPIGVYVFGVLSDQIGRKKSFFICLSTLIVGNVCTALSTNFWVWTASRMFVGLTIPAVYQIPFIISLELVGPHYRSFVTVMTCMFYTFGLILLSMTAYFIRKWNYLAYSGSLPFTLYFIYWWFLPESPRWLLSRGRIQEALNILESLARVNGKELPFYMKQKLKRKMLVKQTSAEKRKLAKGSSIRSLCATPNMRLKTILITLNWFANDVVYVGLSYYGPALGSNEYVSFLLSSVVEIPSCLICWYIMDHWGRRWPLSICMLVSGTSCIITVLLPEDAVILTLVLFLFSKFAISASFLIIYPFAGELYPTQLRGIGIGFSAYVAGLGLIIIPFITYLGRENLILPLIIMGIVSIIGGIVALRLPETLHHKLPQTVLEGEAFGKNWTFADCFTCPTQTPYSGQSRKNSLDDCKETMEMLADFKEPKCGRKIVRRQSTIVEAPSDTDGVFQLTYWM